MATHSTFARFVNDLISRCVGGAGIGAAVLGVGMISMDPAPLVALFGSDIGAAVALAALLGLGGILLVPMLSRRYFNGPQRGRRRRGVAQVAVVAAVLVLGALVIRAAMPPADWAGFSTLLVQGGISVLALLALTWLAPATGLDPRALDGPFATSRRQRRSDLRRMRHARAQRQART